MILRIFTRRVLRTLNCLPVFFLSGLNLVSSELLTHDSYRPTAVIQNTILELIVQSDTEHLRLVVVLVDCVESVAADVLLYTEIVKHIGKRKN